MSAEVTRVMCDWWSNKMYFLQLSVWGRLTHKHLTHWSSVRNLNPFSVVTCFEELLKITAHKRPTSLWWYRRMVMNSSCRRSTWKGVSRDSATPWSWSVLIFILKPLWTLLSFHNWGNIIPPPLWFLQSHAGDLQAEEGDVTFHTTASIKCDMITYGSGSAFYIILRLISSVLGG